MSFLSIPPNFILAKPVEQTLSSKNNFSKSLFKKRNLFYFNELKAVTNFELFLSDSSNLHVYKGFKVINNHKTFNFNGVRVHVASQEKYQTKESVFNILLENYFKTETSNDIKATLKSSAFSIWTEKELYSFWAKNLVVENTKIADLIDLLDTDVYSNEALIALGEKLLKTIKNKPNKYQNLFNIYFKMGNCYFHENEPKKALKFYKKAAVFLNYIDVHHHFLFYFNLAKTKKSIGLVTEIEEQKLIYFFLSKENWEKKLYKNDLKDYFQISA